VVVHDLDVVGAGGSPSEAEAPLLVDADAVLPGTIAGQLLEAVTWWDPEITEGLGGIEDQEFAQRCALRGSRRRERSRRQIRSVSLSAKDRSTTPSITHGVIDGQRYGGLCPRPAPRALSQSSTGSREGT